MAAIDISQIAELIGISAVVSTLVNFALEEWKYKNERVTARQEEHLKYSVENYPLFSEILTDVVNGLEASREASIYLSKGTGSRRQLEDRLSDLLYLLGRLLTLEQRFREKGQIFRLASQSGEILTEFLYELGKNDLRITAEQEIYLAQDVGRETLKQFRETVKTDPELGKIRNVLEEDLNNLYPIRFAIHNFEVLSRLLNTEIQSIRIPGYEREPISLSRPDQDYIEDVRRIPRIFFSRESLDDPSLPLRIWVYNHWNHEITFRSEEVQLVVQADEGDPSSRIEMDLFDPSDHNRKKQLRLRPGGTLLAEWDLKWKDGEPKSGDVCLIHYLPNPENTKWAYEIVYGPI